ncbi:MAG: hypothetical protein KGJ60_12670 [Verrucomicrobiota bacterium]|nr:hypothetical protein [Verrucomicrobiota bacterium]
MSCQAQYWLNNLIIYEVVKSVVADKNYGDDSALYERMGYVRKSVRHSGLTRKKSGAQSATSIK